MRHLRHHAKAFAQRGMRVDRFADVHRVGAHLGGQCDLADHVARTEAHDAAGAMVLIRPHGIAQNSGKL